MRAAYGLVSMARVLAEAEGPDPRIQGEFALYLCCSGPTGFGSVHVISAFLQEQNSLLVNAHVWSNA